MWKLKVIIQFFLALLPGGERINYLLQHIRSHTPKNRAERIIKIVESIHSISKYVDLRTSTVVEIGTGWDAIGPLLLYLMGAKICYTYDHVPHVRFKLVQSFIKQVEELKEHIMSTASLSETFFQDRLLKLKKATNLRHLFKNANIIYNAPGDASKTGLPDNGIDVVFSYAVLEHVPEKVIHAVIIESRRILKKNGIAYHLIGLHDHYAGTSKNVSKVNFLQYSEKWWVFFVKNKISYHNRLREKQFLEIFNKYGAKIIDHKNKIDPSDLEILKKMKVNKHFSGMTHKELAVHRSEIIMSF